MEQVIMLSIFNKQKKETVNASINPHTVLITVGPTYSGKTTVTTDLVKDMKKKYPKSNVVYLSSDQERKELLGADYNRHSNEMMYVSKAAFDILFSKLEASLQYPQSLKNHLVIVDTTGFSESFRNKILEMCKKYQYETALLLFSYKDKKDYFEYVPKESIDIVTDSVDRFNRKVINNLGTKSYNSVIKISKKNTELNLCFNPERYSIYLKSLLPTEYSYGVIGDIHCNLSLLKKLLHKIEEVELIDDVIQLKSDFKLILNGDIIDKNPEYLADTLHFLHLNKDKFIFVSGNHESFCYKYLKGLIKDSEGIRFKYFDSIPLLEKDVKLKQLFFELYEVSQPFYIHRDFVVQHSPCPYQYIGKTDTKSIKYQVKNRYPQRKELNLLDYTKELEKHLSFIDKADLNCCPYVINGHISINKAIIKNKHVLLDTRAEEDYYLSCALIKDAWLNIISVKGSNESVDLPQLFKKRLGERQFKTKELNYVSKKLEHNQFNYLAGTISPADSEGNELESLKEAIYYYKDKGVYDLVMQVKRMGSNCTLYLKRDGESYAVTRNGYKIKPNYCDLTELLQEWRHKVFTMDQFKDKSVVIINGELEPWSLLAQNLIDKDFTNLYIAKKTEVDYLKEHKFEYALEEAEINQKLANTNKEINKLKKYFIPLDKQTEYLNSYIQELQAYSKEGTPSFHPFNVLKTVDMEGEEEIFPFNNYKGWHLFNELGCIQISLVHTNLDKEIELAYEIYKNWTNDCQLIFGLDSLEGVVIKPLEIWSELLPAIKVRNSKYLQLVYGPCYEENLDSFIKTKKVGYKRKVSLEQWKLAQLMLKVPYDQITEDPLMTQYVAEMSIQENKLEKLDPRL